MVNIISPANSTILCLGVDHHALTLDAFVKQLLGEISSWVDWVRLSTQKVSSEV